MRHVIVKDLSVRFPKPALRKRLWGRIGGCPTSLSGQQEVLRNVSVEFASGERIGLIGHNGAGKTTFLRALAGVYPPSTGELIVTGTIRSLFSLHAGLDSDASARRNIYLIGLAQGISFRNLQEREEEIINFSGLRAVIDRPIRTFSNGMAMRLAYSVITSDSADILLIDEIVGTGDIEFQTRSIARTLELAEKASIFVLASHDNSFLKSICSRGLVFSHGAIVFDGPIAEAISAYMQQALG